MNQKLAIKENIYSIRDLESPYTGNTKQMAKVAARACAGVEIGL